MKLTFESLERRNLTASVADLDSTQLTEVCLSSGWLKSQPPEAHADYLQHDLDGSGRIDVNDSEKLLADHSTVNGDFNLDGQFNSSDWVFVFGGSHEEHYGYESGEDNALWWQGDANCDAFFSSADLVYLMQQGNYERSPIVEL